MSETLTKSEVVRVTRVFDVPRRRLYEAWTRPDELARWFGPKSFSAEVLAFDLREGGRYRLAMKPDAGETRFVTGEFKHIVANEKLVFTWRWAADGEAAHPDDESLVSIEFRTAARGAEIVLLHENLAGAEARAGHRDGWEGSLACLEAFVAPGDDS